MSEFMKILGLNTFIALQHILPKDTFSKIMSYRKNSAQKSFFLGFQEQQHVTRCPSYI